MDYLRSAPKSPPQGGGPPRPPHFYNYAERKHPQPNPNPNPMQFQARATYPPSNRLPEDNTIEQIEQSSESKSSSLLTVLLVSLTVAVIVGGLGIGGYFAFRHKKPAKARNGSGALNTKPPEDQQSQSRNEPYPGKESKEHDIDEHRTSASESREGEATTTTESKTSANTGSGSTISVQQIYFQNIQIANEYVGCAPHPFSYDTLSTLEGIATLLEGGTWHKEEGEGSSYRSSEMRHGLCEYLEKGLMDIEIQLTTTDSVHICSDALKLVEHSDKWLRFLTLSTSPKHKWPNQRGKYLELHTIVFKENGKSGSYVIDSEALQSIISREHSSQRRRRLLETRLPSMDSILSNRDFWKPLPDHYRGNSIRELKHSESEMSEMEQNPVSDAHLQLGSVQNSGDATITDLHYQLHSDAVPESYAHVPHKDEDVRKWVEQQRRRCNPHLLTQLFFVSASFQIKAGRHDRRGLTGWHCQYQLPRFSQVGETIFLTKRWWHSVLTKSRCSGFHSAASLRQACDIIEEYMGDGEWTTERDDAEDSGDCDCLKGCGEDHWMILDDGHRLGMLDCASDVHVVKFVAELTSHEPDGSIYDHHHRMSLHVYSDSRLPEWTLRSQGIPFAICTLDEEREEQDESYDDPDRRVLLEKEHESGAFSKDNMYMIIGSTILCVMIGIQSFYWLSHSY